MSLLVWLPLNGNLRNQGCSNVSFGYYNSTSTYISSTTGGKVTPNCFERTAVAANSIRSSATISLPGDLTMCCWANITDGNNGTTVNGIISHHSHGANAGFGINALVTKDADSNVTKIVVSASTGNGSSRTYNTYKGTTDIKNSWHHLALTYSHSAGVFKLWVDGNLELTQSYTNTNPSTYFDLFNWSTTSIISTAYRAYGKLNDVRLYDTCLTAGEIKELARGLVLHYPMNRADGRLGGRNLIEKSTLVSDYRLSAQTGAATGYNYNDAGYSMSDKIPVTAGDKITLSAQQPITGYLALGYFKSDDTYYSRPVMYTTFGSTTLDSLTIPSDITYVRVSFKTVDRDFVKLEFGDKPSLWTPSAWASNNIIDNSGYQNNGTLSGVTWSGTSKIGDGSYSFNGSSSSVTIPTSVIHPLVDGFSIACWLRINSWNTAYQTIWSASTTTYAWNGLSAILLRNNTDQQLVMSISNSSSWLNSNGPKTGTLSAGTWYHVVCTYAPGSASVYVDGVKKSTVSTNIVPDMSGVTYFKLGNCHASSYYCNMCCQDFRIYSTALNADEIEKLYKKHIRIYKNNVISSRNFIEGSTKPQFKKSGVVNASEIVENNTKARIYKNGNIGATEIKEG